jgi:hypothetical protein
LDTYVEIGCAYLPLSLVVTATDVTMQRHTFQIFSVPLFSFSQGQTQLLNNPYEKSHMQHYLHPSSGDLLV